MKKSLLVLATLLAAPFAASAADGVSYNYVEGGYAASKLSGPDADGWSIGGSGAIAPNFHVFGNYTTQKIDNTSFNIDNWRLGVGYNHEIGPQTDILTRVAYERYETDVRNFNGYSVEVGLRSGFTPNWEGFALAGYEDGSDFDGDFYGRIGTQVKFNANWSASGEVKFADGDSQWFVGPRYTW